MPAPTLTKTWQRYPNLAYTGTTYILQQQACLFLMKTTLLAIPLVPPTVWGSNDGDGVGHFGNGDSVDRWVLSTNIKSAAAGNNHSWMVYNLPGMGAKTAFCIDCCAASAQQGSVIFSPGAGFGAANGGTDGTATARPIASDEQVLISSVYYTIGGTVSDSGHFTIHQSTDGKCLRIWVHKNTGVQAMWMFETAKNPIAAWTNPVWAHAIGSATGADPGVASVATWYTTAPCKTVIGGANCTLSFTGECTIGYLIGVTQTYIGENSAEWPASGIGLWCTTAGHREKIGEVFDLWWGSATRNAGDHYQADGARAWAQMGDFIITWGGDAAMNLT